MTEERQGETIICARRLRVPAPNNSVKTDTSSPHLQNNTHREVADLRLTQSLLELWDRSPLRSWICLADAQAYTLPALPVLALHPAGAGRMRANCRARGGAPLGMAARFPADQSGWHAAGAGRAARL